MTTATRTATSRSAAPAGPRRIRGLAWLLTRQHRTALVVCAATTVLGAAWIVYQRGAMLDTLHAAGWPRTPVLSVDPAVRDRIADDLGSTGSQLAFLPLLLGVFFGAPLLASDQEHGTAHLVTTQSVPRRRWLLGKLGFALTLVTATTGTLSLLHAWWLRSVRPFAPADWLTGTEFDTTGPMLVAAAVFTTSLGITIGALARRAVAAMTVTFLSCAVLLFAAGLFRDRLDAPRRLAFPLDGPEPAALQGVLEVDQWLGTASGKLYGWSTCVHDASPEACRASLGIVDTVRDYYVHEQMAGMQATAAAVFLALAAALLCFLVLRMRRGTL
ncbi:ABC transporter permease [Streptomyces sp. NPDC058646]|uniref:ABC transporter permease n=1 Tax=Streptomyces sp. NPDC058646 TaxID=3346574 RepID=UPI003663D3F4